MASSSDSHDRVLEAVDRYELPLQRYARRLLGDFDLAADAAPADLRFAATKAATGPNSSTSSAGLKVLAWPGSRPYRKKRKNRSHATDLYPSREVSVCGRGTSFDSTPDQAEARPAQKSRGSTSIARRPWRGR